MAFVAWFRLTYPHLAGRLVHIANEYGTGKPDGAYFGKLAKRAKMGVTKGVSDYFLACVLANNTGILRPGLWLEMKAANGTLKPEQEVFLTEMAAAGYGAGVAWGQEGARRIVGRYMDGRLEGVVMASNGTSFAKLPMFTKAGKVRRRGA